MNPSQETFNHDEHLMQCSLNFTDSLKDLKNLQEQLYTAAEYFEASYEKDDHKQFVIESFKEYATKALVSTVDHLGSTASKLNDLLEEKTSQLCETKLRFFSLEQRLQTWQELIDLSGHAQQSLVLGAPNYHKRYMISAGKIVNADGLFQSVNEKNMSPRTIFPRTTKQAAFQPTRSVSLPLPRKSNDSGPLSTESSPSPTGFSFTTNTSKNKEQGKRSVSPFRLALKRSGSVIMRSNSPSSTRNPSEPQRSVIRSVNPPRSIEQEDLYSKKSRHIFKALLSMHRPRKEGVPSRFGDDR
ncbi:scaffold/adaptor protein [Lithospermum erythrorhizon]|uniref:Scaffold/adaptor protein n=1 Tax=Lithospermum erythrorhizon TaxID=34254 RepID=A0AAV3QSJ6_LITER